MGIKGIYRELGPGRRVSLSKFAADKLGATGQPLRIAVDVAIWLFQNQAAKGGANPALRTLFYRLVRLLGLSIQPIFVFDGSHKPEFKRNKRTGRGNGGVAAAAAKRLIRLFGFPIHQAPGEAEAECALLQQRGLVDAVLTEDVDAIMFGCNRTLRNWSAEGTRGSKVPTHVTLYDADEPSLVSSGLDREGMVLIALMSGGDYIPAGVPGCGIKLACEIARAGFGKSLCRLDANDEIGMETWRKTLENELHTNESGFFRTRHRAFVIPGDFPDMKVLRHHTHPVVSAEHIVADLDYSIEWSRPLDVLGLREYTMEIFDWSGKEGSLKFIRNIAPSVLVHRMLCGADGTVSAADEEQLIEEIKASRTPFSVDGMMEYRVVYTPADVLGDNPDTGEGRTSRIVTHDLLLGTGHVGGQEGAIALSQDANNPSTPGKTTFDAFSPQTLWLPGALVEHHYPHLVSDWEARQKAPVQSPSKSKGRKKKTNKITVENGPMDQWVRQMGATGTEPCSAISSQGSGVPPRLSQRLPAASPSTRSPGRGLQISASQSRYTQTTLAQSKQPILIGKAHTSGPKLAESFLPAASSRSQRVDRTAPSISSSDAVIIPSSPETSPVLPLSSPVTATARTEDPRRTPSSISGENLAATMSRLNLGDLAPPDKRGVRPLKQAVSVSDDAVTKATSHTQSAHRSDANGRSKAWIPRYSAEGFFKEVDLLGSDATATILGIRTKKTSPGRSMYDKTISRKACRRSQVSVIDLTGDD